MSDLAIVIAVVIVAIVVVVAALRRTFCKPSDPMTGKPACDCPLSAYCHKNAQEK